MLKRIGLFAAVCAVAVSLAGCGILDTQLDKAAEAAGKAVAFYCENVTIPEVREEFRAAVNAKAAPHSVNVTCATGGPALQSTSATEAENSLATLEAYSHVNGHESSGASPRGSSYGGPLEIPAEVAGATGWRAGVYLRRARDSSAGSPGGCAPVGAGAGEGSPRPQECGAGTVTTGGNGPANSSATGDASERAPSVRDVI